MPTASYPYRTRCNRTPWIALLWSAMIFPRRKDCSATPPGASGVLSLRPHIGESTYWQHLRSWPSWRLYRGCRRTRKSTWDLGVAMFCFALGQQIYPTPPRGTPWGSIESRDWTDMVSVKFSARKELKTKIQSFRIFSHSHRSNHGKMYTNLQAMLKHVGCSWWTSHPVPSFPLTSRSLSQQILVCQFFSSPESGISLRECQHLLWL